MGFHDFFVSYGKFHNNLVNKLIHIVFIPTIVYCIFGIGHYYPITDIDIVYKKLDIGLVMLCILPPVYIYMEAVTGIVTTILLHTLYYISLQQWEQHKDDQAYFYGVSYFWFLVYLKASSWIAQFIGHGVFERRAPALMNNLLSALVAPDFVVIEVMYTLGYNRTAIDKCQSAIDEDIAEYWGKGKTQKETKKAK